jgi:hypothetical protein
MPLHPIRQIIGKPNIGFAIDYTGGFIDVINSHADTPESVRVVRVAAREPHLYLCLTCRDFKCTMNYIIMRLRYA